MGGNDKKAGSWWYGTGMVQDLPRRSSALKRGVMSWMRRSWKTMRGDAQKLEDPSSSNEGSAGVKGSGGVWDLEQSPLRSVIGSTL